MTLKTPAGNMQYSQKGFQWYDKLITRISFLNEGYGRNPHSLSGHIASRLGVISEEIESEVV